MVYPWRLHRHRPTQIRLCSGDLVLRCVVSGGAGSALEPAFHRTQGGLVVSFILAAIIGFVGMPFLLLGVSWIIHRGWYVFADLFKFTCLATIWGYGAISLLLPNASWSLFSIVNRVL